MMTHVNSAGTSTAWSTIYPKAMTGQQPPVTEGFGITETVTYVKF